MHAAGNFAQLVQVVTIGQLQLREFAEVVAHNVFVGDANATMQLHRLLPHVAHGIAQLVFGAGQRGAAFRRGGVELEAGVITHGPAQFQLHFHVRRFVAQGLKAADGHTKGLAGVEVVGRDGQGFLHRAHAFCAQAGDADVYRMLQRGQAVGRNQGGVSAVQSELCRTTAILRAITPRGGPGGGSLHQKQRHLASRHGGHQKGLGLVAHRHQAFGAAQAPLAVVGLGHRGAAVQFVAPGTFHMGQHHQGFTTGNVGQPGSFKLSIGVGRQHGTGDQGLRQRLQHNAAPQLFHHHHAFNGAHAQPAVFFGNVKPAQTQLGQLGISPLVKATRVGNGTAAVKAVSLLHPLGHGITQLLLFVGHVKVHNYTSVWYLVFKKKSVWSTAFI